MSDVLEQLGDLLDADPVKPVLEAAIRHPVPSPTSLPSALHDWAAGRDLALSWQTYSTEAMSRRHAMGIRPLAIEEVDETYRDQIPEHLLFINSEGLIQSGNAVVCVQDTTVRAQYKSYIRQKTANQEGGAEMAKLQEEAARSGLQVGTPQYAETSRPSKLVGHIR